MSRLCFVLLLAFSFSQVFSQDNYEDYVFNKKDYTNTYFAPIRASRDHVLHSSLFQPPMFTANRLEDDTGLLGISFDYTDLEQDYSEDGFVVKSENGLYRLKLSFDMSLWDNVDLSLRYQVAGVDGNDFEVSKTTNLMKQNIKKSVSGNVDLILKAEVYEWEDFTFGAFAGVTIPVDKTKSTAVSRNFDFSLGALVTYQQNNYQIHLNLGFVFTDDPTAFASTAEFNHNFYAGLSGVVELVNDVYIILQATIENPALGLEDTTTIPVGDISLGGRYVFNQYITELWVGHGLGDLSKNLSLGLSFTIAF